jgi:hypothetical protein
MAEAGSPLPPCPPLCNQVPDPLATQLDFLEVLKLNCQLENRFVASRCGMDGGTAATLC